MLKKALLILLSVILISLSLVSCSKNDGGSTKDQSTLVTQGAVINGDDSNDETKVMETAENKDGATIVTEDALIIKPGDYEIHTTDCEYLSDDAISTAWFYEYTDSLDSPCDFQVLVPSNTGTMTTAQITMGLMNLKNEERTLSDLVKAELYHAGKKQKAAVTVMQYNPGQVTTDGYQVPSTMPAEIKQGEEVKIAFFTDIEKKFLGDGKDLDLKFTLGGDEYIIELASRLKERTM